MRKSDKPIRPGFTLIEAIVVIVIIGVLATLIVPRIVGRVGQSKTAAAQSNAASLASLMEHFRADCEGMPDGATIDVLWEKPSDVAEGKWRGPYVQNADALKDPWGRKFTLRIPGQKNVDFDVVSYGADNKPGGTGEDEDIIKP